MIELPMFESIPVKPRSFFVLTPSCRTLSQLPGDEDMDDVSDIMKIAEGIAIGEACDKLLKLVGYHAEEEY